MPQATTSAARPPVDEAVDRIQAALQIVAGSITQVRVHERLLHAAGVRLDRAGAALLYKLHAHGDSLRVTDLAELLGVDAPTVTRKIQQLERTELVSRHPDPDDRRATRIKLTRAGRRTLERVLKARRDWLDRLVADWDDDDLAALASLLTKFSVALAQDMDDARVG
jgi:DNA-binding MarR family transcriptional regulator